MEYGLIGGRLGHSYSKVIHEMLCGYRYDLCPLPTEEEVRAFMTRRQFRAINVTIPYKLVVMEYCSYIDPHAKAINAVNTIVNRNGLLYGYNTDYPGFSYLCDAHGVEFKDRTVLILGTGGTHNTTWAVAHDRGAKQIYTVSRHPDPEKGELTYAQALTTGAQIIINTTPVGMYPNVGVSALDITSMPGLEAVIDVIYNPDKTELILRAEELGVPVAVGGLEMLVAQAVYAAEFFLDRKFEDAGAEIARVTSELRREQLNIALIGMPSSGKSTLGRALAERLGKRFVDLDEEIVKADGRSIPDIFAANRNSPGVYIPKPGNQICNCGFPGARRSDQGGNAIFLCKKANIRQNISLLIIGKIDVFKGNIKMRQLYIFFLVRKRLRVIRLFQIVYRQVQVFQQIIRVFKSNQQSRQRKAHQHKSYKLIGGNRTSKKQIAANQQI